jgi:hypothetical protein
MKVVTARWTERQAGATSDLVFPTAR